MPNWIKECLACVAAIWGPAAAEMSLRDFNKNEPAPWVPGDVQ